MKDWRLVFSLSCYQYVCLYAIAITKQGTSGRPEEKTTGWCFSKGFQKQVWMMKTGCSILVRGESVHAELGNFQLPSFTFWCNIIGNSHSDIAHDHRDLFTRKRVSTSETHSGWAQHAIRNRYLWFQSVKQLHQIVDVQCCFHIELSFTFFNLFYRNMKTKFPAC